MEMTMNIQRFVSSTPKLLAGICFLLLTSFGGIVSAQQVAVQQDWFDRQTDWNGYPQFHFKIADRPAYVVVPKQAAAGNPWIWRARFPGYHAEMDLQLVGKGFHVAYVDVAGMFGSPQAVKIGDEFYQFLTTQRGLSEKPVLEGVSRGGLFVYNWAAQNPHRVACIYCDTPVCDFKSWPGGKGTGLGSANDWQQCLGAYGFTEEQALQYDKNPIDHAETIAKAGIPVLHIVSENDRVVPPRENTYLLQSRMKEFGAEMQVISVAEGTAQSNGHHFEHPDPKRVVDFILQHAQQDQVDHLELLRASKRIVFLGDSITYAGEYVAFFDTWLSTQNLPNHPVVIDAGLPSETVSGLSEEGHAGGKFPRPDLAERLQRVLETTKPDLVFACYGINCGIYQPLDAERFAHYQQGIANLEKQVAAAGARLVLITPPFYDDLRAKKSFSYDEVLAEYAKWLLTKQASGQLVISLHEPMAREVARRRETLPAFTFQPDAVHPNSAGHWFIASELIRWFGDETSASAESPEAMLTATGHSSELLKLVRERLNLRRDAYLSAAGHKRPGIQAGLSIEEAEQKAQGLTEKIRAIQ
jgi:sialidase-1